MFFNNKYFVYKFKKARGNQKKNYKYIYYFERLTLMQV